MLHGYPVRYSMRIFRPSSLIVCSVPRIFGNLDDDAKNNHAQTELSYGQRKRDRGGLEDLFDEGETEVRERMLPFLLAALG